MNVKPMLEAFRSRRIEKPSVAEFLAASVFAVSDGQLLCQCFYDDMHMATLALRDWIGTLPITVQVP